MTTFVHFTSDKNIRNILRSGIRANRRGDVYAMPVVPCFFRTHQWQREIKRKGQPNGSRKMVAVYFRIPDSTVVRVGRYSEPHVQVTAAQAAQMLMRPETPLGFEVVIERAIERKEIQRVSALPQTVGWRYFPDAHKSRPCSCDYCTRGQGGARSLRERALARGRKVAKVAEP